MKNQSACYSGIWSKAWVCRRERFSPKLMSQNGSLRTIQRSRKELYRRTFSDSQRMHRVAFIIVRNQERTICSSKLTAVTFVFTNQGQTLCQSTRTTKNRHQRLHRQMKIPIRPTNS